MSTLKVNNLQVGQDATATNNFTLYQPAVPDGTVRLGVGNFGSVSDRLTLTSSGELLLGTSSTGGVLRVYGSTGRLIVGDTGTSYYDSNNHNFRDFSTFASRLYIKSDGNVGIATDNPVAKLQINTVTGTTGLKIIGIDTDGYSDLDINSVGTSGYSRLFFSDTAGQSGSIIYGHSANSLQFTTGGSISATLGGDGLVVGDFTPIDTRNAGGVQVAHSKGISFRSNTSQSVSRNWRIRNDDWGWGNLDFGVGDSVSDISDSAGDTVLSLTSSRNVGIGTVNPVYKLDVLGTCRISETTNTTYGPLFIVGNKSVSNGDIVHIRNDGVVGTDNVFGGLKFSSAPGADFVIGKNSRLGTGYFQIRNQSNTELLTIDGNGNVGIGTADPLSSRLAIQGNETNTILKLGGISGGLANYSLDIRQSTTAQINFVQRWFTSSQQETTVFSLGSGNFFSTITYSTVVGGTNRDLFVDSAGLFGYVASIRDSKSNIQNLTDINWIYSLNPVSFNRRKLNENKEYTDETYDELEFGLIAEEVEEVIPELCFYDDVDGNLELRGVHYRQLITPLVKAVQDLKTENELLKSRLDAAGL